MNDENLIQELSILKQEIADLKQAQEKRGLRNFISRSFSKMNVLVGVGITVLITSLIAYAAQIPFQDGELIIAKDVNDNFTELYTKTGDLETADGQFETDIASLNNSVSLLEGSSHSDNVITTSVTKTVGAGGDYANFIEANNWLKDKIIVQGATVTLQLTGDLTLSDPASYTWPDERESSGYIYAGVYILHRDGDKIVIDLNTHTLTVGNGTDAVHGIFVNYNNSISQVKNGTILSANNGQGYGVAASESIIFLDSVTVGASGKGFSAGVYAAYNSTVGTRNNVICRYCSFGFLARTRAHLAVGAASAQNCNIGYRAEHGGHITTWGMSSVSSCTTDYSPTVNTFGNWNGYIAW